MNDTVICMPASVCPQATAAIVFRDTTGSWKGRYVDAKKQVQEVQLGSHGGEIARDSLAHYLGIQPDRVYVFDASGRMY